MKNSTAEKIFCLFLLFASIGIFLLGHCEQQDSKQQPKTIMSKEETSEIQQQTNSLSKPRYHYAIDINTTHKDELYEVENAGKYIKAKRRSSITTEVPDGHYEWDTDILLNNIDEIYEYLKKHYKQIKSGNFDEISYYEDMRDDYIDDPEDEIRFPPEIFETLDD